MTYTGRVKQGVVVFEGTDKPAEGQVVQVFAVEQADSGPTDKRNWDQVFEDLIGVTDELPQDMAEQHDHYIHGTPKDETRCS